MKLITVIKPSIIKGYSKSSILNGLYTFTFSNYGSYYSNINKRFSEDEFITVINFQKFNRKTKQTQKVVKGKNVTTSKVIRESHWIGYIYKIPKSWLSINNKKVFQHSRNFVIVDNRKYIHC